MITLLCLSKDVSSSPGGMAGGFMMESTPGYLGFSLAVFVDC